ncbi:MAG: hypothetical protein O2962_02160 [Cyanobacteria bacterium]|nr:hypothetical protein [Cyanobacteriota bacterium]
MDLERVRIYKVFQSFQGLLESTARQISQSSRNNFSQEDAYEFIHDKFLDRLYNDNQLQALIDKTDDELNAAICTFIRQRSVDYIRWSGNDLRAAPVGKSLVSSSQTDFDFSRIAHQNTSNSVNEYRDAIKTLLESKDISLTDDLRVIGELILEGGFNTFSRLTELFNQRCNTSKSISTVTSYAKNLAEMSMLVDSDASNRRSAAIFKMHQGTPSTEETESKAA